MKTGGSRSCVIGRAMRHPTENDIHLKKDRIGQNMKTRQVFRQLSEGGLGSPADSRTGREN